MFTTRRKDANTWWKKWFSDFGVPQGIISDTGLAFVAKITRGPLRGVGDFVLIRSSGEDVCLCLLGGQIHVSRSRSAPSTTHRGVERPWRVRGWIQCREIQEIHNMSARTLVFAALTQSQILHHTWEDALCSAFQINWWRKMTWLGWENMKKFRKDW